MWRVFFSGLFVHLHQHLFVIRFHGMFEWRQKKEEITPPICVFTYNIPKKNEFLAGSFLSFIPFTTWAHEKHSYLIHGTAVSFKKKNSTFFLRSAGMQYTNYYISFSDHHWALMCFIMPMWMATRECVLFLNRLFALSNKTPIEYIRIRAHMHTHRDRFCLFHTRLDVIYQYIIYILSVIEQFENNCGKIVRLWWRCAPDKLIIFHWQIVGNAAKLFRCCSFLFFRTLFGNHRLQLLFTLNNLFLCVVVEN